MPIPQSIALCSIECLFGDALVDKKYLPVYIQKLYSVSVKIAMVLYITILNYLESGVFKTSP